MNKRKNSLISHNLLIGIFIGVLFVGISFLLYHPALKVELMGEDISLIRNYRVISDPTISTNFRPAHGFLFYLTRLVGSNPFWFHWLLIIFHGINALFVWIIINRITKNKTLAWLVSLAFIFFPRHPQAIYYLAQSTTVSITFFLWSMLSFIKYLDVHKRHFYIISLLLFILAMLTHPMVFILPVFLFLFEKYFLKNYHWQFRRVYKYIPYIIIIIIYASVVLWGDTKIQVYSFTDLTNSHPLVGLGEFTRNFSTMFLAFWPISYNRIYLIDNLAWGSIITFTVLVVFIGVFFIKKVNNLSRFLIIWMILPIFFYSLITHLGPADRYLYLSSIGFITLILLIVERIFKINVFFKIVSLFLIFLWIGFSLSLLIDKSKDWQISNKILNKITQDLTKLYPILPEDKHIYTVNFPLRYKYQTTIFMTSPYDYFAELYGPMTSYQDIQDKEIADQLQAAQPKDVFPGVFVFYYKDGEVLDYSNRFWVLKELLNNQRTEKQVEENFWRADLWDYRIEKGNLKYRINPNQIETDYLLEEDGKWLIFNNDLGIVPNSQGFNLDIIGDKNDENLGIEFWDAQTNQTLKYTQKIDFFGKKTLRIDYQDMVASSDEDRKYFNRLRITVETTKSISGQLIFQNFKEY